MFRARLQPQSCFSLNLLSIAVSEFSNVYWLLGREAELQRLMRWATRKRLTKPRQLYQKRLADTQMVLSRIQLRSPQIFAYARVCFGVADTWFPPPKYPRKGSAAGYKSKPR
jgi:hypothetical protein